jgi:hypothetical protein
LDYKKIIVYLIIILAAAGYWYKTERDEKNRAEATDKFTHVYAATAVFAELYRNEPERFMQARDSIYEVYSFDADSINAFRITFDNKEEEWTQVWISIRRITDSLVDYFRADPIEHPEIDTAGSIKDSAESK